MTLEFFIPHAVSPKQTKHNRLVKRKDGSTFIGRFTPKKVKDNEEALASLMAPHVPEKPLEGPLMLRLVFDYPWRKSEKKANIEAGSLFKDTRPDNTNLAKQFEDVMESMGFFGNDAQIAISVTVKRWTGNIGAGVHLSEIHAVDEADIDNMIFGHGSQKDRQQCPCPPVR